jgi:hypothetical protein
MMIKTIGGALAVGAFILGLAAALRAAQGLEMLDADTARRAMQVTVGLILAAYANYMPKQIGRRPSSAHAAARSQSVLRVGGWSITLAGLAHASIWAFAPIAFANVAAMLVVAAALLVTLSYGGWTLSSCRRTIATR